MVFWNRVIAMAEFCLDCWNKIMGSNDSSRKYMLSEDLDLCEECGEMKPVIVRIKWRYATVEWFFECIEDFRKSRN